MRSIFFMLLLVLLACGQQQAGSGLLPPTVLTCEYVVNPLVVDRDQPRLAWVNTAEGDYRGQKQTAYQIRVSSSNGMLDAPDLWDSGKVPSDQSNRIPYQGVPLVSHQDCWWQVRVWDKDERVSEWSRPARWSMGLLEASDWQASWIGAPWQGEEALPEPGWPGAPLGKKPPPSPYFRKDIVVSKKLAKARAYVTGLGYFEFYVNGRKQGEEVLIPNQTNYSKRAYLPETNIPLPDDFQEYKVMYLAYDITGELVEGQNTLGAILGNGFYDASKYWSGSYGSPRFIGQVHLTYQDGTTEVVVTDDSWHASTGPIQMDMVYYGEVYDARLEHDCWSAPGFDEAGWQPADIREKPFGKMVAHTPYADRIMETFEPLSIEKLENGNYLVDFGVEISGWVRLKGVNGPAGHQVDIRFLSNTFSGDNTYILSGNGQESYAPRFNWFVFSAVEIINWPGELTKSNLVAEAVNTYIEESATFETSNQLFNDINRIWRRSQLDNMHGGIASDCPHRERSAYTGDAQVVCETVMQNYDARSFYDKWIADMRGSQIVGTGYVPNCAPWQPGCGGGVAWGAAMCIIPWDFYQQYGALDILTDNYQAMKGYVDYMKTWVDESGIMHSERTGKDGKVLRWFNLGDWSCVEGNCPPEEMVHTYFYWKCIEIVQKTASIIGKHNDAQIYRELLDQTAAAFHKRFYQPESQTYGDHGANVFALSIGVPESRYPQVVTALKQNMERNNGHLHTGIFGTRLLFKVLSENGLHQMAYRALNKTTYPSFGYWLEDGATTTRESWENQGSHNHPMFGGGLTWFYQILAGMQVDPDRPGYKHIVFRPRPLREVQFAKYFNRTIYGNAGIQWEQSSDMFRVMLEVPVSCSATVYLPVDESSEVTESGKKLEDSPGVSKVSREEGYLVLEVRSGRYQFESTGIALEGS